MEENIKTVRKEGNEQDLKKLNALFRKYDRAIKARYDLAPFNEPVLMLTRENGKTEFFDKAVGGNYTIIHSDGEERTLTLKGFPLTMQFYDQTIKYWNCHENFPFPRHNETPLIDSELYTMVKNKDLNDSVNYQTKRINAKTKMIGEIFKGVAIIIAVFIGLILLGKLLGFDLFDKKTVIETTKVVAQNTTNVAKNITII